MRMRSIIAVLVCAVLPYQTAGAADDAPASGEMLTAIDAATMTSRGVSDAEIVRALSRRPRTGNGEEMISYLVANQKSPAAVIDARRATAHKNAADRYFREASFAIAAKEYALAIEAGGTDYLLYEGRANSYASHLKTELLPRQGVYSGARSAAQLDRSKAILCDAAASDYQEARRLNDKAMADIAGDIYLLQYNMKTFMDSRVSPDVKPYYGKSAQKSVDMLKLRQLSQAQKIAYQDARKIKLEQAELASICGR